MKKGLSLSKDNITIYLCPISYIPYNIHFIKKKKKIANELFFMKYFLFFLFQLLYTYHLNNII